MATYALRAGLWGARRYGPALARTAIRYGRALLPRAASAARVARIGQNIPLRTLNAGGRYAARRGGFTTMRGMGTRAFATGAARTAKGVGWRTGVGVGAAAAAAGGVYQGTRSGRNKNNKGSNSKSGKKKQNQEQIGSGDSGDNITTTDTFSHKQGNEAKIKNMKLISGLRTIRWNTTGGILGKQGIAVWGYLRYKPFAGTDNNVWHTTGMIKEADQETHVSYRTGTDVFEAGKSKNQLGFLERNFVIDSVHTNYEFKNQSNDPAHLEYYVVAYGNSGAGRNVFEDIRDGYYAKSGQSGTIAANYPTTLTNTEAFGAMESNTEVTPGNSKIFRANWNILYKHKVKIPEGGVHIFDYHQNSNRIIGFDALYKRDSAGTALVTNYDALKNITFHIIYKVYGNLADNSNDINTIGTTGVGLTDTKIIYRCKTTLNYRQSFATPNIMIEKGTALPTTLTNAWTKDGNTGALEDGLVE